MRSTAFGLLGASILLLAGGCSAVHPVERSQSDEQMFGPVSMRIHPTFTAIKSFTGKAKPDGVEVVVELDDQFGDPTRAGGKVMFELYAFRQFSPDPKGERVGGPWAAALSTPDDQSAHWNSAVRGYSFQLAYPQINTDHPYVLTAQFDINGTRLFDQIVLEPATEKKNKKARHPIQAPEQQPDR